MQIESINLTGKILIAMPDMGDPRFERSVIFMCAHSDEASMGLIVNKPTGDLRFRDLLKQLELEPASKETEIGVHMGGPVDFGRGFVLHSRDYESEDNTLRVSQSFGMTATLDILEDIAQGIGPQQCILAMGYAGWGPGQLEEEIQRNGWLIGDASLDLVFGEDDGQKWTKALADLGIDPLLLSPGGGSA